MASDFHTHNPELSIPSLLSANTPGATGGKFVSMEYHPWYLPAEFLPLPENLAEKLTSFSALGEVGLDKCRGPELEIQKKYLHELLKLAHDLQKPVVLHVVRAYQELFAVLKPFKLDIMIHGFCGSPELLDELWKRKFTVSFSKKILQHRELMTKLKNPSGAFGFESDADPDTDIRLIMQQLDIPGIEQVTDRYFTDFLRI